MNSTSSFGRPAATKGVTAAYTGTAAATAAMPAGTHAIRVVTTTDAFIEIGPAGTVATSTGTFMAAFVPEYFTANSGEVVSAIQVTGAGSVYVVPMS